MQKKIINIIFVLSFFLLLSLKETLFLAIAILFLWGISFKEFWKLNLRVIKSILIFNLGISIGFIIMSAFKNMNTSDYLIYINLKVYALTYFVFWFFTKVSIVEFFSFSKDLSYLTTITLSQIYSYKKTFEDFKMAFKARVYKLTDKSPKFITRTFEFFLTKALKDSKERSLAMKARGFF